MIFSWDGIAKSGTRCCGEFEAESQDDVLHIMRKKEITVIKIWEKKAYSLSLFRRKRKVKPKYIADFLKQLKTLSNANISLVTALNTIANDNADNILRRLIITITQDIKGGVSLSAALRKHPAYFDELLCNLIDAGERSGTLDTMLKHVSFYITKSANQKRKFVKALVYPIAVIVVALMVSTVLLIFVIPKFKELFLSFGADLPLYTRFILDLANKMQKYGWCVLVIIASFLGVFVWLRKYSPLFSHKIDRLILCLPIYGDVLQKVLVTDYARVLAVTFKAGLPLLDALTMVSGTMRNWSYRRGVLRIRQAVSGGQTLYSAMQAEKLFPSRAIQLVTIGEESGSLDDMLLEIAQYYDAEVDDFIDNLNNLLEPMLMVVLGVIVGGIVIGMYLPIFRLGSVI